MHGLQEVDKTKERDFKETIFFPNKGFKEELNMINNLSDEQFEKKLERTFHSAGSDISQVSHWSCNIETIKSNVGGVVETLRSQEKNIIGLMTENEELRNELVKKEKEIKKQKFLLKAEREMFEKYKRDTLTKFKKNNSEECPDEVEDKPSRETIKLNSELAHYRQMYLEMNHTVNRLSKLVSLLKDDKIHLKNKLLQQEKRSNRFIYEMAQRFDISRREWNMVLSKKFETVTIPATNLALCKIADRNARLAYDNSMLKLELNMLRKRIIEKNNKENKLQCLTDRTSIYRNIPEEQQSSMNFQKCNMLKSSSSGKSDLSIKLQGKGSSTQLEIKTSVTSILKRNKRQSMSQEQVVNEKIHFSKLNVDQWDCSSERSGPARTESAPELYHSSNIENEESN